ncbi:hypothetical protein FA15DRAFT_694424 [Coprinopsis marcescibilis]|uniref:Uncharacterized protein n=1 Tax=Coprinopsis marcescibilis TaxID=230819 RepID=A0A5C3KVV9_COPMA|nr:hypothetical protein FA15DRAFT_694424 [Coprinopsis marcescibilis]
MRHLVAVLFLASVSLTAYSSPNCFPAEDAIEAREPRKKGAPTKLPTPSLAKAKLSNAAPPPKVKPQPQWHRTSEGSHTPRIAAKQQGGKGNAQSQALARNALPRPGMERERAGFSQARSQGGQNQQSRKARGETKTAATRSRGVGSTPNLQGGKPVSPQGRKPAVSQGKGKGKARSRGKGKKGKARARSRAKSAGRSSATHKSRQSPRLGTKSKPTQARKRTKGRSRGQVRKKGVKSQGGARVSINTMSRDKAAGRQGKSGRLGALQGGNRGNRALITPLRGHQRNRVRPNSGPKNQGRTRAPNARQSGSRSRGQIAAKARTQSHQAKARTSTKHRSSSLSSPKQSGLGARPKAGALGLGAHRLAPGRLCKRGDEACPTTLEEWDQFVNDPHWASKMLAMDKSGLGQSSQSQHQPPPQVQAQSPPAQPPLAHSPLAHSPLAHSPHTVEEWDRFVDDPAWASKLLEMTGSGPGWSSPSPPQQGGAYPASPATGQYGNTSPASDGPSTRPIRPLPRRHSQNQPSPLAGVAGPSQHHVPVQREDQAEANWARYNRKVEKLRKNTSNWDSLSKEERQTLLRPLKKAAHSYRDESPPTSPDNPEAATSVGFERVDPEKAKAAWKSYNRKVQDLMKDTPNWDSLTGTERRRLILPLKKAALSTPYVVQYDSVASPPDNPQGFLPGGGGSPSGHGSAGRESGTEHPPLSAVALGKRRRREDSPPHSTGATPAVPNSGQSSPNLRISGSATGPPIANSNPRIGEGSGYTGPTIIRIDSEPPSPAPQQPKPKKRWQTSKGKGKGKKPARETIGVGVAGPSNAAPVLSTAPQVPAGPHAHGSIEDYEYRLAQLNAKEGWDRMTQADRTAQIAKERDKWIRDNKAIGGTGKVREERARMIQNAEPSNQPPALSTAPQRPGGPPILRGSVDDYDHRIAQIRTQDSWDSMSKTERTLRVAKERNDWIKDNKAIGGTGTLRDERARKEAEGQGTHGEASDTNRIGGPSSQDAGASGGHQPSSRDFSEEGDDGWYQTPRI